MEQYTTYRANGKSIGLVFLFKYDLNGNLKLFEIVEGTLTDEQMKWLYSGNFPATEAIMKANWQALEKYKEKFEIVVAPPDLSFDALWSLYDRKVSRLDAEKAFNKLKPADLIKCFTAIPEYNKYLARERIAKAHLSTFINKRRFEDEFNPPAAGTNQNPVLRDLANRKTDK